MKFSDKKTCQIIIENLFIKCVFPVLETFISSSLIKIVCKCNQIRGNESWRIFQEEISRKKIGFLLLLLLEFCHRKIWEMWCICLLGLLHISKVQKLGG